MARALRFALVLALTLPIAACDSGGTEPPPPAATTGTVSGSISLPIGSSGSVGNTRVAMYQNVADWQDDRFVLQVAAGGGGEFTFSNVVPGTYYFDAWKDNNNNGAIDGGDYFGVLGSVSASGANLTPIQVAAGQSTPVSFQISIIGGAARIGALKATE